MAITAASDTNKTESPYLPVGLVDTALNGNKARKSYRNLFYVNQRYL
jgi:hypothetical protein